MKITLFSHSLMWSNDISCPFAIMRYIIIISAVMMMGACSNDKILQEKLEALYSTPVVFPNSGLLHIDNVANSDNQEKRTRSKYKLLVFSGPDECSICAVTKMSEWNMFLNLEKEGNTEKLYKMAWRVRNFREKVVSPATKDMKRKAKKILDERCYTIQKNKVCRNRGGMFNY